MIFKSIEIQNFMAIRSAKIPLDSQGLVLIRGINGSSPSFRSNGAGKSTIAESIVYVLFGRTLRGLKGDEVVNNVAKANCKVTLDLVDDDGSQYRIVRYRKHKSYKNSVVIFLNGKDITPKSDLEATKLIISILNTDFLTFTSSILYSAESFKFTQATDSEMKAAFDIMLDLKVYAQALEETKKSLKEVKLKESEVDSRVRTISDRKGSLERFLREAANNSENFENSREGRLKDVLDDIKDIEAKAESEKAVLAFLEEERKELAKEAKALKTKATGTKKLEGAIADLNDLIASSKDEKLDIEASVRSYTSKAKEKLEEADRRDLEIKRLEKKIEGYLKTVDDIKNTVGTPCPTCGKPLDEESIEDSLREVEDLLREANERKATLASKIESLKDEAKDLKATAKKEKKKIEAIEEDLENYKDLLAKSRKKLNAILSSKSKALEKERELANTEKEITEKELSINSFKERITYRNNSLEEIKKEENPYLTQVSSLTLDLEKTEEDLKKADKEKEGILGEREILEFWEKGFSNSGIKSLLLDDITPFLNKRANTYLNALSGGRLSVNFSTLATLKSGERREKFNIELINQDGGTSYLSNSSGEKRRVDVAVNLALCDLIASRANKKINLLFADEVFDSLDDSGVEAVMSLLRELSKEKSSIFVISHNDTIQSFFDKVLTVKKEKDSSSVEYEG